MSYFGVNGGVVSPGFSGAQATSGFGAQTGRRLTPDFGIGAYYQTSNHDDSLGASSTRMDLYGVEGNYYFTGDMDGMVLGVKFGLATLNPSGSRKSSSVSFGPRLAFDHRLTSSFSAGFEGSLLTQGSKEAIGGYTAVNLQGVLKLWF